MVHFPQEFYTSRSSVQMFELLGWFSVWCQGASFHSPCRCFRKLHTGPHSGWSHFCRHVSGGEFPFLLPLSSIDSLQRFWRAFYPLTRWYLVVVLICISPALSDVDIRLWDIFFKGCELNLPLEIGFLNVCSVLNSISMSPLGHFFRADAFYWQPPRLSEYSVHQHSLLSRYRKWELVGSISSRPTFSLFFFFVISFSFYIGAELISSVVFKCPGTSSSYTWT